MIAMESHEEDMIGSEFSDLRLDNCTVREDGLTFGRIPRGND